jgi:hypothetical protein
MLNNPVVRVGARVAGFTWDMFCSLLPLIAIFAVVVVAALLVLG